MENTIDKRSMLISDFDCCPHCNDSGIKRSGFTGNGRQRYRCSNCGKTFTGRVNSIIYYSMLGAAKLRTMLSMLLDGCTLAQVSHQVDVSVQTVLLYRRKMQKMFEDFGNNPISGNVCVDET